MATTIQIPQIGMLVYPVTQPMKAAIIVAILPNYCVETLDAKGEKQIVSINVLRNFQSLIDDHERKYKKFNAMAGKLAELIP